ncbi:MAG: cytochrome c-type biogenesis protein CcmF, partial [Halobacteriales archaeon]
MMIGTLLQYGAAGTGIVGTGLMLYSISNEEYAEYGAYLTGIASLFSALALFYLANQFLVTDYTNGYVWTHVADYLSPLYRVTALYSGVEGSLLLWATLVGLVAYWTVRTGVSDRSERIVATITVAVAAVFYVHAAIRTPFTPLDLRTGGTMFGPTGLNPLLKSPYMAIHPPITFIGYSLTVVPFAIGITHFLRLLHDGEGTFHSWVGSATRWLRLSWGFLTASVALGAFWSYTTLGWGGLWAWDPVETAILVTWLFVTATLHVLSNYRARGEHPLLAPTMTVLSLPSAIFARFITQSGTSELHSFASGASPILTALLVVTTVVAVVLPLVRWLQLDGSESGADQRLLSHPFLLSLGSMVIGVLTFVSFWGLIFPQLQQYVGGPRIAVSATFYNMWSFPLVLVVLLLIGLYNDFDVRGREGLKLLAGVIVLSAAAALVPLPAWQINPAKTSGYYGVIGQLNILALAPPAAYAIGATVTRLGVRLPGIGSRERRLALSGVGLVHVGIVLIVLSAPFTYMFASSAAGMVPIAAGGHGGGVTLGESTITVSASNYNASYVHSDLSLSDRERGTLR